MVVRLLAHAAFALILAISIAHADIAKVSSCQALSVAGENYTLNQSITVAGATCFNATAQNTTLDCAGFSITGNNTNNTYGLYSNQVNTRLKNCNISGFKYGIYLNGAPYSNLSNNTAFTYFQLGHGIYVKNSNYTGIYDSSGWYNLTDTSLSAGIFLDTSSYCNLTNATAISGISQISFGALALSGSNFNIITNSSGNSSNDTSGIFLSSSGNNTIDGCTGYTASGSNSRAGVRLDSSTGNLVRNTSGRGNLAAFALTNAANFNTLNRTTGIVNTTSSGRYAYLLQNSANNTLIDLQTQILNTGGYALYLDNCNSSTMRGAFLSSRTYETLYLRNSNFNIFANSTLNSTSSSNTLVFLGNSNSNTFQNMTFLSPSRTMVSINGSSGLNLFYWDNFTATSGLYVNDTNGSNTYNSTVSGQPEGNVWADVANGSVAVSGSNLANYGGGLYVGNTGSGVPYNSSKTSKLSGNVVDYAPLTPNSTTSNTPPVISAISISPAAPSMNSTIYCNITATDAQQSILTINYTWNQNGSPYIGASALSNNNTPLLASLPLNASMTSIGANWSCSAFASDGLNLSATNTTGNVTVTAVPPTYGQILNNGSAAKYGDNVSWNATLFDLVSLSSYTFSSNASGAWANETAAQISGTSGYAESQPVQVPFTNGSVLCGKFYFNNTAGMNNETGLSCFTVADSPPVVVKSNISANQDPVYPDSTLIGSCNATDPDSDAVSYIYSWYVNGALSSSGITIPYPSGTEVNVNNITSGLAPGQTWKLECAATDGQLNSTSLNSSGMLIVSYPWQVMNITIVFATPPFQLQRRHRAPKIQQVICIQLGVRRRVCELL